MTDAVRLHPADVAEIADRICIELSARLAAEVLAALNGEPARVPGRMLTAAEVAELVGLGRDAVYRRADEFGAVRIGSGPKGRLRFDAEKVTAALGTCCMSRDSQPPDPSQRQCSRPHRAATNGGAFPLLPVRGV